MEPFRIYGTLQGVWSPLVLWSPLDCIGPFRLYGALQDVCGPLGRMGLFRVYGALQGVWSPLGCMEFGPKRVKLCHFDTRTWASNGHCWRNFSAQTPALLPGEILFIKKQFYFLRNIFPSCSSGQSLLPNLVSLGILHILWAVLCHAQQQPSQHNSFHHPTS